MYVYNQHECKGRKGWEMVLKRGTCNNTLYMDSLEEEVELPEEVEHGAVAEELRAEPVQGREAEGLEDQNPYLREKRKELRATPQEAASSSMQDVEDPNELVSAFKKAKVTGKGVEMVERITTLLAVEDKHSFQRTGFLQVRLSATR